MKIPFRGSLLLCKETHISRVYFNWSIFQKPQPSLLLFPNDCCMSPFPSSLPPPLPLASVAAILPRRPHLQPAQPGRLGLHSGAQNILILHKTKPSEQLSHLFAKSAQPNSYSLFHPSSFSYSLRTQIWNTKLKNLSQTGFQVEKIQVNLICVVFGRGE